MRSLKARGKVAVLSLVLATAISGMIAAPAHAGTHPLNANGCSAFFENDNSPTIFASTYTNGTCGNIGLTARQYYGGGVYAYPLPTYYGSAGPVTYYRFNLTTIQGNSRHYYQIPRGLPTYYQLYL